MLSHGRPEMELSSTSHIAGLAGYIDIDCKEVSKNDR